MQKCTYVGVKGWMNSAYKGWQPDKRAVFQIAYFSYYSSMQFSYCTKHTTMLWGIPLSRVHDLQCHEKHESEFQVRKLEEPGQPLGLQSNMATPIINTEIKPSIFVSR